MGLWRQAPVESAAWLSVDSMGSIAASIWHCLLDRKELTLVVNLIADVLPHTLDKSIIDACAQGLLHGPADEPNVLAVALISFRKELFAVAVSDDAC